MRKRNIFLALMLVLFMVATSYSASLVTNLGIPNSSGVGALQIDSDRNVKIASDADLVVSGDMTVGDATVNVPVAYSVALSAGATTDEMDITITCTPARVHQIDVWITDTAATMVLTSTTASGALTAVDGEIQVVDTAKKHIRAVTPASGIINLSLVDSGNTVGEIICLQQPDGLIVQSDPSAVTDYEGEE